MTLSLSSCSFIHVEEKKPTDNYDSTKPWLTGKTVKGHNFTYDITTEKFEELTKEMKKAKEYASEDSHYDYFYEVYTKLESFYYEARDADQIEFLEYSFRNNQYLCKKEQISIGYEIYWSLRWSW